MNSKPPIFSLDIVWRHGPQGELAVDPQLFALLDAIRETRKLTAAATRTGLHYRQAWGLIALWSDTLGHPLALKERGKGTSLTKFGERFLDVQKRVRDRMVPHLTRAVRDIDETLAPLTPAHGEAMRMVASHDLLLMELRHLLHAQAGIKLDIQIAGSTAAITSLSKSRCDIAGFHLPEGDLGKSVLREFRPWLRPRTHQLVYFARRTQGLIVAHGNPLKIQNIADIVKAKARFINRQRGSGTQIAFDLLLERHGVDSKKVIGYSNEEYTHAAIASTVASGGADVGLGIESAARKLNVGFVPMFSETYFLLLRRDMLAREDVQNILKAIGSKAFRKIARALPGYDISRSGDFETFEDFIA